MTFKDLLTKKKITGYALAKNTGIPYTTINDLINGRTIIQNVSLKNAVLISDFLNIDLKELNTLDCYSPIEFRYFRSNVLHDLKRNNQIAFIKNVIKKKEIDFYYKNNAKEYSFYLLALIDYLSRINNVPLYEKRYNEMRKEKLDKPFYVGSDLIKFQTIKEAEDKLHIATIPEFKKFNIIEEDVFNAV